MSRLWRAKTDERSDETVFISPDNVRYISRAETGFGKDYQRFIRRLGTGRPLEKGWSVSVPAAWKGVQGRDGNKIRLIQITNPMGVSTVNIFKKAAPKTLFVQIHSELVTEKEDG